MGGQRHLGGHFDGPALARRHWVVSFDELVAAGLTKRQVLRRAADGVLHRIHHGVYAVGRPELSFEGWCRAAVLACGPGSAVSHWPAARLHEFAKWSGAIHVSGPRSLGGHPKLIVHRPRSLPLDDLATRNGVPVTSVARTLLDLAPFTSIDKLGGWIHEAGVQRGFTPFEVWAVLERHPHHRGRRKLEAALEVEVLPTRSGLEKAFVPIIRQAGLPTPLVNSEQWSGEKDEEVDFCWPDLRLIVETDGGRYHWSRWRQRRDAAKDERFRNEGWVVWRVPELAISLDPGGTARHLATLGRPK
ncbi:MAG: type IV toxin-antitoxin system AbiEi family antitoxin domain-containing protein [Solirubrobacteraceae bacterium]